MLVDTDHDTDPHFKKPKTPPSKDQSAPEMTLMTATMSQSVDTASLTAEPEMVNDFGSKILRDTE